MPWRLKSDAVEPGCAILAVGKPSEQRRTWPSSQERRSPTTSSSSSIQSERCSSSRSQMRPSGTTAGARAPSTLAQGSRTTGRVDVDRRALDVHRKPVAEQSARYGWACPTVSRLRGDDIVVPLGASGSRGSVARKQPAGIPGAPTAAERPHRRRGVPQLVARHPALTRSAGRAGSRSRSAALASRLPSTLDAGRPAVSDTCARA